MVDTATSLRGHRHVKWILVVTQNGYRFEAKTASRLASRVESMLPGKFRETWNEWLVAVPRGRIQ